MVFDKEITMETIFHFGKHKGKTIEYVINNDPSYITWCVESIEGFAENLSEDIIMESK